MEKIIASAEPEKKKTALLKMLNIALDCYEDIFSDFDPAPISQRILSDDFLKELRKRHIENKKGEFLVRFCLPKELRSLKTEALVRKRIKEFFAYGEKGVLSQISSIRNRGIVFFMVGFLIILASALILYMDLPVDKRIIEVISIMLSPLGWFGMWEGTGMMVMSRSKYEDELWLCRKFINATYSFIDEEALIKELSDQEALKTSQEQAQAKEHKPQ